MHGDDFIAEGDDHSLDTLDRLLSESFELIIRGRIGPDSNQEGSVLKRKIGWNLCLFSLQMKTSLHGCFRIEFASRKRISSANVSKFTMTGLVIFLRLTDRHLAVTCLVTCTTLQSREIMTFAMSMSLFSRTVRPTDQNVVLLTIVPVSLSLVQDDELASVSIRADFRPRSRCPTTPPGQHDSLESYSASCCIASSHNHVPRCCDKTATRMNQWTPTTCTQKQMNKQRINIKFQSLKSPTSRDEKIRDNHIHIQTVKKTVQIKSCDIKEQEFNLGIQVFGAPLTELASLRLHLRMSQSKTCCKDVVLCSSPCQKHNCGELFLSVYLQSLNSFITLPDELHSA